MTARLVLAALLLPVLAACDAAAPAPAAEVRLVHPFADLSMDPADEPRALALDGRFEGNAAAGPVRVEATVLGDPLVEATLGASLVLRGLAEGETAVRVEARGANGGVAADTFAVVVWSPCPRSARADEVEMFPVAVGSRWAYTLETSHTQGPSDPYDYRSRGEVVVEVVDAGGCASDAQTFRVEERRTETFERDHRHATPPGTWEVYAGPTTTVATHTWTVTDSLVATSAPWPYAPVGGSPFEPPPFGEETPRFAPLGTTATSSGLVPPHGPRIEHRAGVGPVLYAHRRPLPGGRWWAVDWTLAE
ncbi:hypothetical protein [Rubrivirga sp. IMCC45206]|uniref:hypothetical protein n=1 Tax=Rubrivirga sp. IMCC45206 TaxID=3391614 RepID=UPI00398F97ED